MTKIKVTEFNIDTAKTRESFSLALLSDLHGYDDIHLADMVHDVRVDFVIFCGDMINYYTESRDIIKRTARIMNAIEGRKIFVMGNHEKRLDKGLLEYFLDLIDSNGTQVLKNEFIDVSDCTRIYGLDIGIEYYKNALKGIKKHLTKETVRRYIGSADVDKFNILLAHNPLYFKEYAQWGADLTLSGHVHGGIIGIGKMGKRGLLSPERVFFPQYCAGEYSLDDKKLIVSRGISNGTLHLRINNPSEIVVIHINKQNRK